MNPRPRKATQFDGEDMKPYTKLALILCLILLAAACNKSGGIKLSYEATGMSIPCEGELVVFKFDDKRSSGALGRYSDNTIITSLSDVADWVGWALFDELDKAGCEAKYRTSTVAPGDTVLVTGEVLSAALNQTGAATFEGALSVRIMVIKAGQTVHVQKYSSQVEDVVVPGYSTETDIMAEALRGIMAEAVPAIVATVASR